MLARMNRACAVVCLLLMSCAAPEPGPPPEDGGAGTVCDYSNCNGCCQNGVCYSGYENETCGLLGQQCRACPEWYPCSKTRRCAPPEASAPSQQGTGWAVVDAKLLQIDPADAGEDGGAPPPAEKPSRCYDVPWVRSCP